MIISFSKKFIFMKTRKTAGSSIQAMLSKHCDLSRDIITGDYIDAEGNLHEEYHSGVNVRKFGDDHPHPPIDRVYAFFDNQNMFDEFFKFAVVRNPYDLVVSRYHWDRKYKQGNVDTSPEDFQKWVQDGCIPLHDIQYLYTHYKEKLILDFIIKYENLTEDLGNALWVLGINDTLDFKLKSGYRDAPGYRNYYNPEVRKIVKDIFSKDFEYFNYRW